MSRQSRKHHCRPAEMSVNALAQLHQSKLVPKMEVHALDALHEGRGTFPAGTWGQSSENLSSVGIVTGKGR